MQPEFKPRRITSGLTRIVILLEHTVVKIARPDDGVLLKNNHGRRANLTEARLSVLHPDKLCPVLWSKKDGSVLIARRAEPLPLDLFKNLDVLEFRQGLPIEMKADSFGLLDGRIVAVDYGG
jgi:hypothetical protein